MGRYRPRPKRESRRSLEREALLARAQRDLQGIKEGLPTVLRWSICGAPRWIISLTWSLIIGALLTLSLILEVIS